MMLILAALLGFFIGAIPSAYFVGKAKGIDIRKAGSGNPGTTNALRTMGKKAGAITFLCDFAKGFVGCGLAVLLAGSNGLYLAGPLTAIGHCYSPYLGFRGGKGVATSFAVMFCLDWRIALPAFGCFLLAVALTRYVSLGSVCAALFTLVVGPIVHGFTPAGWAMIAMAILVLLRHSQNIKRLLSGTESKIGSKKKGNGQ